MRRYRTGDYPHLRMMFLQRQLEPPPAASLSEVGFIIPDVAAGFLYRTDSDVALLEAFVTHPDASSKERDAGLDEITTALLEAASLAGFKRVVAICSEPRIAERAERHGLRGIGTYQLLGKEI